MISINTNISDLILLNSLNSSTNGLGKTIERLTTGYKLNHAKDNAANVSIVNILSTKISSLLKLKNNTEDGISLLSTAQGSLENIQSLLERLRSLSIQAANGTYGSQSLNAMQAEADQIIEQIKQIRNNAEFNGIKLFEGPVKIDDTAATTSYSAVSRVARSANIQTYSDSYTAEPIALASETYNDNEGAISFSGNETKTVTICGISYELTNTTANTASISYKKDTSTGQITFIADRFTIKGQTDKAHNIVIRGNNNIIYGGSLDDILADESTASNINSYYGGAGNDTITLYGHMSRANGEAGDDTINSNGKGYHTINGGDGNDNITLSGGYGTVHGNAGNDTFTIKSNSNKIYGDSGDDTFNFVSGTSNIVNGGEGHNISTGSALNNNYAANMDGANYSIEDFAANETRTININGIDYTITSKYNESLMYQVNDSGQIAFSTTYTNTQCFTIKGQADKAHNVVLRAPWLVFYGGELADTIEIGSGAHNCSVYGLGGDDNITITSAGTSFSYIDGGAGNDTITSNGTKSTIIGGAGNDNITIANQSNSVHCGDGDDTVTTNAIASIIYGGSGNNTLINKKNDIDTLINGFGDLDNASALELGASETKTLTLGGKNYTIKNQKANVGVLLYEVNPVTGVISFGGNYISITAQKDVAHNVILSGFTMTFNGGDLDDYITTHTSNSTINSNKGNDTIIQLHGNQNNIHGNDGNDTIHIAGGGASNIYGDGGDDTITLDIAMGDYLVNGGLGNDTYNINKTCNKLLDDGGDNIYYVNVDGASISGGGGNDTFYVKGNNNTISTGAGDDYVILDGNNNIVDGGSGVNSFVDNGINDNFTNVKVDPNSGVLTFNNKNEVKTFEMHGVTYTVTNQNASGTSPNSNTLKYSYNENTGVITFNGNDFTIYSNAAQNKINLRGDNNTINGGTGTDIITIESGTNNIINGLGGDDTLIMNSENNSLNGGDGNDTITLNASTNKTVTGGSGNDTISINSSNNTSIDTGSGDDRVIVNGSSNVIKTNDGNNNITLSSGNDNEVTAGNGNNHFIITSDNNTVTAGSGNNIIGIQGNSNSVNAQKASSTVNIIGDNNSVNIANTSDSINIKGSQNHFESQNGDKNIIANGNNNTLTTGNSNDKFDIRGNNNNITTTNGNNQINLRGDSNFYQGGNGENKVTISGNGNTANGGNTNDQFTIGKGSGNIIDGKGGNRNTIINNGVNTQFSNVVDITPRPFELDVKVDLGSDSNSFIHLSISFNLFDFDIDFMNAENLEGNIERIDDLLSTIDSQLINIGSTINRLESVLDAQNIKLENMLSSRSTLQDADVAEESSDFIRYQILQQASATLASSTRNINREFILGILGVLN